MVVLFWLLVVLAIGSGLALVLQWMNGGPTRPDDIRPGRSHGPGMSAAGAGDPLGCLAGLVLGLVAGAFSFLPRWAVLTVCYAASIGAALVAGAIWL